LHILANYQADGIELELHVIRAILVY